MIKENIQTKQLKLEKKFIGIQHLLNDKKISIRMLFDMLISDNHEGFKTSDMLWWVATGVRPPRDTNFYFLVSKYLDVPVEEILKCYSNQIQ